MSIVISSPKKNKAFDQTETFNDDADDDTDDAGLQSAKYRLNVLILNDIFQNDHHKQDNDKRRKNDC